MREGSQAEGADQGRERESTCPPGRLDLFCVPFPDTPFTSPPSLYSLYPGSRCARIVCAYIAYYFAGFFVVFLPSLFVAICGEGEQKALVMGSLRRDRHVYGGFELRLGLPLFRGMGTACMITRPFLVSAPAGNRQTGEKAAERRGLY